MPLPQLLEVSVGMSAVGRPDWFTIIGLAIPLGLAFDDLTLIIII